MNWIKKAIKENWLVTVLLTLCSLVIFYEFLFQGKLFEFIADQQLQYHLFYEEWSRLIKDFIKTGEYPFYSWYTFLGSDFFASKMYYVVFDFFMPVVLLFEDMSKCMMYVTVALVVLSGISMRTYLSSLGIKKNWVKDLVAIIYALSGIATLYYGNYMFHRFYALLPFLFAAVENYIRNGKKLWFAFMVFVLFTQNYYFMFPTALFLVGYYLASKYSYTRCNLLKNLQSALPLIGAAIVGVLLAGIVLVPTVLFLLTSPRMGNASVELFWEPKVYLGIFMNLFVSPFTMYTSIPYPFYSGSNGHGHWYSLFASALTPAVLVALWKSENRKFVPYLVCAAVYFAILMIKPFNSIMHGFSEASFRWVFLLVFVLLGVLALYLDENKVSLKKTMPCYILVIAAVTAVFIGFAKVYQWNISEYSVYLMAFGVEVLLGVVYLLLMSKQRNALLFVMILAELVVTNRAILQVYSSNYYQYEDSVNPEYVQYFLGTEENQMARIYLDPATLRPFSAMNMNQSLNYRYMSTVAYDSTYESVLTEFLSWQGINWHIIDLKEPEILRLLGVKYIGVFDPSELPENGEGYVYEFNLNAYQMYVLPDANSIAHTFSSFISKSDFEAIENKSEFEWNEVLVIHDEDMSIVELLKKSDKSQFEVIEHSNNRMYGHVSTSSDTILFTAVPYSTGWHVYSDGIELETMNVDGGFLGVVLPAGEHYLTYQYTSPGFKVGVLVSLSGALLFIGLFFFEKRKISLKGHG